MSTSIDPQIIKRNRIIFFMSLAIIILLFLLFKSITPDPKPVSTIDIDALKKTYSLDSIAYANKMDSLRLSEEYWKLKASAAKIEVPKIKEKTKAKIEEIKNVAKECDTIALIGKVEELEIINEEKDSVFNEILFAQDSLIASKDLQILESDNQIKKLEQSYEESVKYGDEMKIEATYWKKQTRKSKVSNTMLKIGIGVAAALIIQKSL